MKVYLAVGIVDFEGGTVLGVYSTSEKAFNRIDRFRLDYPGYLGYDRYEVQEAELDTDDVLPAY